MGAYTRIDDIRDTFISKGYPEWELYNGKPNRRPKPETRARYLFDESSQGASVDESWIELEDVLNKVSLSQGNAMLMLGPKDQPPKFIIPIKLSRQTTNREDVNRPGITGTNTPRLGMYNREQLEDKLAIYDLKRKIEDLENAQIGGTWERIGEMILERVDLNQLVPVAVGLIGKITGGIPSVPQPTGEMKTDFPSEEVGATREQTNDLTGSIERLMENISKEYPDERSMKDFFDKLNKTIESNPGILKQLQ